GNISSYDSTQVVMNNMPTCANCHSFSADGNKVGMDIDFRADKGGYMIAEFTENTVVTQETILSWTDFNRNRRIPTLGLLSRISPDGNFILSSVHDRSVFIDQNDPYFSQLFFPVRGILAFYDVKKQKFFNLPGADDPEFVQSNGVWSPDGQTIIFARAHAPELNTPIKYIGPTLSSMETALVLGTRRFMDINADLKPFLFDLYKIPFNDGKGGSAELLQGASNNGKSNFFAKYSPDGKWIVFTQAPSYMLNQRGSELYIMPANDGPPRRMNCNTSRMNSWHSWSPNSKWLVFSSKELGPYTQLFLTHIDEKGYSTPPVWLRNFTSNDRAVNIPEFVNIKSGARRTIDADYIRKNNDLPLGQQD
ncbi:PD40 domain-containing protein, partial [candidate division KSB1 bacterium]|nr:PD40 domain-containing protein [candidate division KSB1 bacterium]